MVIYIKGVNNWEFIVLDLPNGSSNGIATWKRLNNNEGVANSKAFDFLIWDKLNLFECILNILQIKKIKLSIATYCSITPFFNNGIFLQLNAKFIHSLGAHFDNGGSCNDLLGDRGRVVSDAILIVILVYNFVMIG